MKSLKKKSGQATLEYILLIAMSVGFLVIIQGFIQDKMDIGISGIGGNFERQLRTSSLPAKAWEK